MSFIDPEGMLNGWNRKGPDDQRKQQRLDNDLDRLAKAAVLFLLVFRHAHFIP